MGDMPHALFDYIPIAWRRSSFDLDASVRIDRALLDSRDDIGNHSHHITHSGELFDLGHGRFGLTHGALRMNAATRIDRLMADRTTEPGRDRRMEVFGVHPEVSGGGERDTQASLDGCGGPMEWRRR